MIIQLVLSLAFFYDFLSSAAQLPATVNDQLAEEFQLGQTNNNQPMAGVRVLDIATFVAAPFCGTILADFGAEVIKIEQPEGGDIRPAKSSSQPRKAKTWRAHKFRWAPVLAF